VWRSDERCVVRSRSRAGSRCRCACSRKRSIVTRHATMIEPQRTQRTQRDTKAVCITASVFLCVLCVLRGETYLEVWACAP
jgi:hypothetical protein